MEGRSRKHIGNRGHVCSVTQDLVDIVRKQDTLIEQEKIAAAIYPELCERRKTAENELDIIEQKLRRL